jgi:hypothetical protein
MPWYFFACATWLGEMESLLMSKFIPGVMLLFKEILSQSVSRKNSTAKVDMNKYRGVGGNSNRQRRRGSYGKRVDSLLNCAWLIPAPSVLVVIGGIEERDRYSVGTGITEDNIGTAEQERCSELLVSHYDATNIMSQC